MLLHFYNNKCIYNGLCYCALYDKNILVGLCYCVLYNYKYIMDDLCCCSLYNDKYILDNLCCCAVYMSQCQNSSKFLSVSYLMKTTDVIMNLFSSHNTTDHT